jgi:6-pyruvoyltetrahydropterin/6-carboxytetrahydropterin synthase
VSVATIAVKHNVEMAHRLLLTPGKCQQIHGHSWQVTLRLWGEIDEHGLLEGLDFGGVKATFRKYLDTTYDHRLLLNKDDPWAGHITPHGSGIPGAGQKLPGLQTFEGDPTTELLAVEIAHTMERLPMSGVTKLKVIVWETKVNNATWEMKL